MARVGSSEYVNSYLGPAQQTQYFREVINRGYWDHPFHPLSERPPKPSYKDLVSSSVDSQSAPWRHLRQSYMVGKDDGGTMYIDRRQDPRGMTRESKTLRATSITGLLPPQGKDPTNIAKLPTFLRTSASSGALPMAAKMATMRGETDLFRSDRMSSDRAPTYSSNLPGWGSASAPNVGRASHMRPATFTRILNV
ncbi:unnamed protein product [Polarella glacialis]|uniref:Uncharacterized protein n=1 Tax=Polarella glacialis TaxID=89957 RepID=A0A813HJA9_POLGL|nr:unnamed protein product [Polarella glacialis]